MRVLITGRGTSGSWKIRGEQLGAAIGATVVPEADMRTIAAHDMVVLVKRGSADLLQRIRVAGVPLVYDVVDAWPQPEGNSWGYGSCMSWLSGRIEQLRPAAIVAATQAMAIDCRDFGVPVLRLQHHARPNQEVNPLRERVATVGYEGSTDHLGRWAAVLEQECRRRGWRFQVNPRQLADLDLVVALRERQGYAAVRWKSGVKLSNAQATGTPFIGAPEAGYLEQAVTSCERWSWTADGLSTALDELTPLQERQRVSALMRTAAPSLPAVAHTYLTWLQGLPCANPQKS